MNIEKVRKFVYQNKFLTLATASKDGIPHVSPHARPYNYASDGASTASKFLENWVVFVGILPNKKSVENLKQNPWVHFEIHNLPHYHDIFTPKMTQIGEDSYVPFLQYLQVLATVEVHSSTSPEYEEYWKKLVACHVDMRLLFPGSQVILELHPEEGTYLEYSGMKWQQFELEFI